LGAIVVGALVASTWDARLRDDSEGRAGVASAATIDPAHPRIEITKHAYSAPSVTIPAGGTVTWTNRDDDVHTVVSTTDAFRSPAIDTGEAYAHTFAKPGVFHYFCTLHPLMTGTVIVK
jgi:plastocyanin